MKKLTEIEVTAKIKTSNIKWEDSFLKRIHCSLDCQESSNPTSPNTCFLSTRQDSHVFPMIGYINV